MKWRQGFSRALGLLFLFSLPLGARGEWRLDPVTMKIKWANDQSKIAVGSGWGYYNPNFRWTNDWRWRNDASPTQPAYFKTALRQRVNGDWWAQASGEYGLAPSCDFRLVELEVEKTLARPVAFRLWGAGEWRRVTAKNRLEDYDRSLIGSRLRWRLHPQLQWKGELSREWKTYPSPAKSSEKNAVSNEVTWRFSPHTLLGRWTESTRVYPGNAWENYHYRSWRLEWNWGMAHNAYWTNKYSLNFQRQGSGKKGSKLEWTGILDYPNQADSKLSWMLSGAKTLDAYDPLKEDGEEVLASGDLRLGLRWQDFTPPLTVRTELFGAWKGGSVSGGGLLRLQGRIKRWRWTLGLAPRGGFYPTEEKGYWLEVKYYWD